MKKGLKMENGNEIHSEKKVNSNRENKINF